MTKRPGKYYQMLIVEYAVARINDWENATQCNLMSVQLHKQLPVNGTRVNALCIQLHEMLTMEHFLSQTDDYAVAERY